MFESPLLAVGGVMLLALLTFNLLLIQRAERHYAALPSIPDLDSILPTSKVTVIVPARNEAAVIERCVGSLRDQHYPLFSVVVVDDASTDGTGDIAARTGAQVLRLDSAPPAGWTGKCRACDYAARSLDTDADWLLFTDADTWHHPDALRRAVAYAEQHQLAALSLLLKQECDTLAERLVLPLAYQNLFAALDTEQSPFNGQYILIRRTVYEQTGGFAAPEVRGRVMEDVALAGLLRRCSYHTALLNGDSIASVRMYRSIQAIWHGMSKTTFTTVRDRGLSGTWLMLPICLGVFVLPLAVIGVLLEAPLLSALAVLNVAVTGSGLVAWLRRFGVPTPIVYALLNPLGVTFLCAVGAVATLRAVLGLGVRWKDRTIKT
jgi:chlorobactene glucosyltransferase